MAWEGVGCELWKPSTAGIPLEGEFLTPRLTFEPEMLSGQEECPYRSQPPWEAPGHGLLRVQRVCDGNIL